MFVAERLPSAVRLMADVAAGGDTKKLADMMEKGQLKPQEILPKYFAAMGEKAKQGWDVYIKSVAYQQGQAQNAFAELVRSFTFNGGDQGFANVWKFFQESLRELTPIAKLLGESFYDWTKQLSKLTNTIRLAADGIERVNNILDKNKETWEELKPWITKVAEGFFIFKSTLYRFYAAFRSVVVLVEDLLAFIEGKGSVIGEISKALKEGNWSLAGTELTNLLKAMGAESIAAAAGIWGLWKALKKITSLLGIGKGASTTATSDKAKGRTKLSRSNAKSLNQRSSTSFTDMASKAFETAKTLYPAARSAAGRTPVIGAGLGLNELVNDVNADSFQMQYAPVGSIGMISSYRNAMIGMERAKAIATKKQDNSSWDYLSPNVQDFIKSMTNFQGVPALSERLNDMTNLRGATNSQGQIVIQNLNMNVSGNNAPPELLARRIVEETASKVLQLTPNSY
jgi:hypothetical protein